jgi:ribosomal protein L40E
MLENSISSQEQQQGNGNVCSKCWANISPTAMFCSGCGNIQIHNSLIHQSTTASYDPRGQDYKPWREISKPASNSWKDRNQSVLVRKREPWRPAMNQSAVFLKKGKGKPTQIPWSSMEKSENSQGDSLRGSKDPRRRFDRISSKKFLMYKGRLWSKSGDVYRKKKTIFTSDMIYGYVPKRSEYNEDGEELVPPIILFPLGIYPLDWVSSHEAASFSVHLTLLRRSYQSKYNHTLSAHWLRVGYEYEVGAGPVGEGEDAEVERPRQFFVLTYLPNCIAKCFGAAMHGSWVDLKYVSHILSCFPSVSPVPPHRRSTRVIPTWSPSLLLSSPLLSSPSPVSP